MSDAKKYEKLFKVFGEKYYGNKQIVFNTIVHLRETEKNYLL